MVVNLTGVLDATDHGDFERRHGRLLAGPAGHTVTMNVLLGDTTANKMTNASDVAQTKGQSGAAVTEANFCTDVNVSGTVTASDIALVKANAGHGLP